MQEKLVNSAFKEGMNKGIESRNIEIAKFMLDEEMKLPLISKITGLSIEEIKDLSEIN